MARTTRLPPLVPALVPLLVTLSGCAAPIPDGRSAVDEVTIRSQGGVDEDDVEDKLATAASPKFLFLFAGVFDYEIFDRYVLQQDLARVERFYRAKGYYEAHARAGRVFQTDDKHVRVEIFVEQGEPVRVRSVKFAGVEKLSPQDQAAVKRAARKHLRNGEPFWEQDYDDALGEISRALADKAYAFSKVTRDSAVDLVTHQADVVFTIAPDEKSTFGKLSIEGLHELPEDKVRRILDLREGEPYSQQALIDAQQALLDLGVVNSVVIEPVLPDPPPPDHVVPLKVKLEESRLRMVRVGPGVEFDPIKTDVHGQLTWDNRNFLGNMRHFSVRVRPGLVLFPIRAFVFSGPVKPIPEGRITLELEQPALFEARTKGYVRPEFAFNPALLSPDDSKLETVVGYKEAKFTIGVNRAWRKLDVDLSEVSQLEAPYGALGPHPINPDTGQNLNAIVLTYPELLAQLDFRNDRIHPRKGFFVGVDTQYSLPLGADHDVRVQPEARFYVPVYKHRVTFATRGSVGFKHEFSGPPKTVNGHPGVEAEQVEFFRGFFSGGPNQNRGYPLRGVGPHGYIPFLNPTLNPQTATNECLTDPSGKRRAATDIPANCRTPLGGDSLWEASAELRFVISGPLAAAAFCDASDVSANEFDLKFARMHFSCGAGARYDTPVGPIRLDIGYRIPGLQYIGAEKSDEQVNAEKLAAGTLLGVPIAIQFGVGESF